MTICHGKPEIEDDKGGGIRNFGTLWDCTVRDNSANGGGIANSGELTLINSTVMDNTGYGIGPRGQEYGKAAGCNAGVGR